MFQAGLHPGRRRRRGAAAVFFGMGLLGPQTAEGHAPFSCGGFAMLGGAQLLCSHIDPQAPTQICTFSWTLMTTGNNQSVVSGSFLLPRGITNATVYQGSGFSYALSSPIVLCQGRKTKV